MSEVDFPFLRGHRYTLGQLRAFEATLFSARQQDPGFSSALRSNKVVQWAKTRNEELLPIIIVADHKRLPDTDEFELMVEGHATDVKVYTGGHTTRYQITIADPAWDDSGLSSGGGGYIHHLKMELLRIGAPAFGGANTKRENGIIVSEPHARDVRDDIMVCQRGLIQAIQRKRIHDGTGNTLLIYARGYRFLLIDLNVHELVSNTIRQAGSTSFERICVVDDRFLWERDNELMPGA